MESISYFTTWLISHFPVKDLVSTIIPAWAALVISAFALRKNIKWKDKFKENAMNEAYVKSKEIWHAFRNLENSLFFLSPDCIGGLNISHYFGKKDQYKNDQTLKKRITNAMTNAENKRVDLFDCRVKISNARLDFKRLGYSPSLKNNTRIDNILEHVMHIESLITSYTSGTFDYFDEEENSSIMRYSRHSLPPADEKNSFLIESLNKCRDDIYKRASTVKTLLEEINYVSGISELYKN